VSLGRETDPARVTSVGIAAKSRNISSETTPGAPRAEEVVGNDKRPDGIVARSTASITDYMGVAFGELALSAAMTTPSLILMETRTVI
jgi:hypothetical protein